MATHKTVASKSLCGRYALTADVKYFAGMDEESDYDCTEIPILRLEELLPTLFHMMRECRLTNLSITETPADAGQ